MPDPILMAKAMGIACAATALLCAVFFFWGRRASAPFWTDVGWVAGLGAGFYLGCWMLDLWPRWPPLEDLDRLMILVIPAVLAVETLAAFAKVPRWLAWVLRLALAGCVPRVLLHGSSYLADVAGPGTRLWSPGWAWLILGILAAVLVTAWIVLALLARRAAGVSLVASLALAVGASALAIMLSGYATGGQAGLPLAAALLGGSAVALVVVPGRCRPAAPIGVALVGLSSLLLAGRFFGELRSDHAILLFGAPLLAWLPELPGLRRLAPWARGLARVLLVGIITSGVVVDAARRFAAESGSSAASLPDGSASPDELYYGR
jgi:hypothetical protein